VIHGQATEREALARVGDLLEQVGLPTRGGQKQRVMIAMALACNPSVIIADEPTTALDVMVQAQVLKLLKGLQRELGLAMLFITHDLSVLVEVADRLAIMYAGKVVEEGNAREVFDGPTHPYSRALADAFPSIGDERFRRRPSGLGGDPPDPQKIPSGCPFHPRCPFAFEACPEVVPELYPSGPDRRSACHLVEGSPVPAPFTVSTSEPLQPRVTA
jgi:peptide/nickel transport system ATP-binding protein